MPYTAPPQNAPREKPLEYPSSYETIATATNTNPPPVTHQRPALPRSIAYLNRHRRTPSVADASGANNQASIRNEAASKETNHSHGLFAHGNNRQTPPPVNNNTIPSGAITTPPDSSSDDEDEGDRGQRGRRGRAANNLKELQEALKMIGVTRSSSRDGTSETPASSTATASSVLSPATGARKISHSRSSGETTLSLINSGSLIDPPEDTDSDDTDSDDELSIKPRPIRTKSGQLVKPALRPSSRRRPSDMPGTPIYSKGVHFSKEIEHVRRFYQIDRPATVGSMLLPATESDCDAGYSSDDDHLPKGEEWEINVSSFPSNAPVRIERSFLSHDYRTLVVVIACARIVPKEQVVCRFTLDDWETSSEIVAEYNPNDDKNHSKDGHYHYKIRIELANYENLESKTMFLYVSASVDAQEHSNGSGPTHHRINFFKKANQKKTVIPIPRSSRVPASLPPNMGQDFLNRYDFGASLADAISFSRNATGDHKSLTSRPKSNASPNPSTLPNAPVIEKSSIQSAEYEELIQKFCFAGLPAKDAPTAQIGLTDHSGVEYKPSPGDTHIPGTGFDTTSNIVPDSSVSSPALGLPTSRTSDYYPALSTMPLPSERGEEEEQEEEDKEEKIVEEEIGDKMEDEEKGEEKDDVIPSELKEVETNPVDIDQRVTFTERTISEIGSTSERGESNFGGTTLLDTDDSLTTKVEQQVILDSTKETEDYMSLPSNDEDIASQAARQRTEQEILAVKLFSLFFAESEELSFLHENALQKLGPHRFLENYRRILKAYVLKLRLEARTALEKDAVKVIESRGNRRSIAKQIVTLFAPENEENTKPLDELAQRPLMKQNLEDWAKTAYGSPDTIQDPVPLQDEYSSDQSDDDNDEDDEDDEDEKLELKEGDNDNHENQGKEHLKTITFTNIEKAYHFLHQSAPFQTLVLQLRLLGLPTSLREIIETSPKYSIKISANNDMSLINRAKGIAEAYTAFQWDWWPLAPRVPDVAPERLRLEWKFCGQPLYREISSEEGELIKHIMDIADEHPPKCHCCRVSSSRLDWYTAFRILINALQSILPVKLANPSLVGIPSPSKAHLRYTPTMASTGTGSNSSSSAPQVTPNLSPNPPMCGNTSSQAQNSSIGSKKPADSFWVVFGIKDLRGFNAIENMETHVRLEDTSFFQDMRKRHRRNRWFFQQWFSPYRFRFCRFVQFERIIVDEVSCCGEALPDDHGYTIDYTYRPRPPAAKKPLIDPARFSILLKTCDTRCYWSLLPKSLHKCRRLPVNSQEWLRIPQKKGSFDTASELCNPSPQGVEKIAFGIEAGYLPSSAFFFFYHALLILSGFSFWIYWLKEHPGDLQNASVPLFTIFAIIAAFWAFIGKGRGVL